MIGILKRDRELLNWYQTRARYRASLLGKLSREKLINANKTHSPQAIESNPWLTFTWVHSNKRGQNFNCSFLCQCVRRCVWFNTLSSEFYRTQGFLLLDRLKADTELDKKDTDLQCPYGDLKCFIIVTSRQGLDTREQSEAICSSLPLGSTFRILPPNIWTCIFSYLTKRYIS